MRDPAKRQTVGFCSAAWSEPGNRRLEGALRYLNSHPQFSMRDFRYLHPMETYEDAPPPWKGKVDGMLLFTGPGGDIADLIRWIDRGGVPVVSLVTEWVLPQVPVVATDSDAAMRMAADYFVSRGYKRAVFLADVISPKDVARRRGVFSRQLVKQNCEALAYDLSFRPDGDVKDLQSMLQEDGLIQLLRQAPKPLAVFAITDHFARALCELCQELKLKVPSDVAILGSGDLRSSRCHHPTISTIVTDSDRIGYEAIKLLHHMLDGGTPPSKPILIKPVKVIERQSSLENYHGFGSVRRALEYIQQHACEGINVNDVVNVLSISRSTLESRFADQVGRTPGQEIHRVRLEKATQLLRETDISITQVAFMSGFSELPPFTKFFRRNLDQSPSDYRSQHRK